MKKTSMIVAILIMAIGFAAVSTTLIIKGSASVKENESDFEIIFTKATLDTIDVFDDVISSDKKTITFTSKDLKKKNDTSILNYEVTNNSNNYDAEVTINCGVKENTTAEYTSITNTLEDNKTVVKAKESVNGTLTITLNKTSASEVTEEYTCTLEFNAVERDMIGANIPTYYYAFGTPTTASTTNYETLNKNVFVRLGSDDSKAVCINDNGLFCIKPNDYDNSVALIKEHFCEDNCYSDSSSCYCDSDAFRCYAYSDGYVSCIDNSTSVYCIVDSDGSVGCSSIF